MPGGRDRGGGQALTRLPACQVGARRGILHPVQPSPSAGASPAAGRARDGGTKPGSSTEPRGGWTIFFSPAVYFVRCQAPSDGVREVPRNKGCRQVAFSSHQPPLFAGKKRALCLETAATPTKTRACKSPREVQKPFCTKRYRSPPVT